MTDSEVQDLQVLELIQNRIAHLAREVEYMALRMKQVELWQATMDMTLKGTFENK